MKSAQPAKAGYSIQEVAELLRLPSAEVRRCLKAGVLSTPWQAGGRVRLNFQDLVLLRSVASLTSTPIPSHRVRRALKRLKARLPEALPLSGVQVSAGGKQVVVRDGVHVLDAESFQLLLDFEPRLAEGSGASVLSAAPVQLKGGLAEAWYEQGCRLDEVDPSQAIHAYRQALARDAAHVPARINLGRLLHAAGDLESAEAQFRKAVELRPEDPTLVFNLGVTLEDSGATEEAMTAYARALFLDPKFADAHFNLARLHELRGDRLAALRHLNAYRNL